MKTSPNILPVLLAFSLSAWLLVPQAISADATPPSKQPAAPPSLSLTNAIPRGVFHPIEGRDPFLRVGYKKPVPDKDGKIAAKEPPKVEVELSIGSIIWLPPNNVVLLSNGQAIKVRDDPYDYTDDKTKTTIKYKVKNITENSVEISWDDKTKTFLKKESTSLEDLNDEKIKKDGDAEKARKDADLNNFKEK